MFKKNLLLYLLAFCQTIYSRNDNLSVEGFSGDTEILVCGGTPENPNFKKMSEIKKGDVVYCIDEDGDLVTKTVEFRDFNYS